MTHPLCVKNWQKHKWIIFSLRREGGGGGGGEDARLVGEEVVLLLIHVKNPPVVPGYSLFWIALVCTCGHVNSLWAKCWYNFPSVDAVLLLCVCGKKLKRLGRHVLVQRTLQCCHGCKKNKDAKTTNHSTAHTHFSTHSHTPKRSLPSSGLALNVRKKKNTNPRKRRAKTSNSKLPLPLHQLLGLAKNQTKKNQNHEKKKRWANPIWCTNSWISRPRKN